MRHNLGLDTLLELDGTLAYQEDSYWVGIAAWCVSVTADTPHGIRYSLTLHNRYGERLLGYDNAHAVPLPRKFKYAGQRLPYDHKHRHAADRGVPYAFSTAYQLLADFFQEVDMVLKKERAS